MRAQGWLVDALCLVILNPACGEGEDCPFVLVSVPKIHLHNLYSRNMLELHLGGVYCYRIMRWDEVPQLKDASTRHLLKERRVSGRCWSKAYSRRFVPSRG